MKVKRHSTTETKKRETHQCPHCKKEFETPTYVFAHWTSTFTVECEGCRKKYGLHEGRTWKL